VQLILQKATKGALKFYEKENIPQTLEAGMVAIHDYRCPEEFIPKFLETPSDPTQHRELLGIYAVPYATSECWSPGYRIALLSADQPTGVFPQQGTTWLDSFFSLETCNWSTLWYQSRPLIAYWLWKDYLGRPNSPGCFIRLRLIKDDFDFASANIYYCTEWSLRVSYREFFFPRRRQG